MLRNKAVLQGDGRKDDVARGAAVTDDRLAQIVRQARARAELSAPSALDLPAAPRSPIDLPSLTRELNDLFWAIGIADDGSETRALWREPAPEEEDHAAKVSSFRRIARAANPLSPEVCSGDAAKALRRKLRARKSRTHWRANADVPPLADIDWETLTAAEQRLFRMMAEELAAYHKGQVKAHRPTKDLLDTLVTGLAEIFVRFTEHSRDLMKLEYAERSFFIQFCHAALAPFAEDKRLDPSEISPSALSQRWTRYRAKHHSKPETNKEHR